MCSAHLLVVYYKLRYLQIVLYIADLCLFSVVLIMLLTCSAPVGLWPGMDYGTNNDDHDDDSNSRNL
jgi:hypothetical protein